MRLLTVILILILGIAHSYSQYYSKSFMYDSLNTVPDNFVIHNNNFIVVGYYPDTTINLGLKGFTSILDSVGNIKIFNTYRPSDKIQFSISYNQSKLHRYKDLYVSAGYSADSNADRNYLIAFIDSTGTLSNYYCIPNGTKSGTLYDITFNNGYFFCSGIKNNNTRPLILKIDTLGNKIFEIQYIFPTTLGYILPQTIIADDSSNLLLVASSNKEYPYPDVHNKLSLLSDKSSH